MKLTRLATAAVGSVAALTLIAGPASAIVTFDPATGTGFVGKGDVQTVFGWNNSQMQKVHEDITFGYVSSARYSQDCEKEVGGERNTRTIENTFSKSVNVDAAIASDSRKTGQWTGWHLKGYGAGTSDVIPTDLCTPGVGAGEDNNGWTPVEGSVVTVIEGSQTGGLLATYNGDSRAIG